MDYLDYLTDLPYDDLPEAVQQSISREEYTERRQMVLALAAPEETTLPPALAAAFLVATQADDQARPPVQRKVDRSSVRWLPWLAAAGWLLFLGVSTILLLREQETRLVEKTIIAPAPPPEVIRTTDTLYQTVTAYKYRTRIVHDTVYRDVPFEQLVLVRDTLYLPQENPAVVVRGSQNLAGKERMLVFLMGAE